MSTVSVVFPLVRDTVGHLAAPRWSILDCLFMEHVCCFYHSNAPDTYGICFTGFARLPDWVHAHSCHLQQRVSIYLYWYFWVSCRCLVIMERDDSSYGGVVIVVLRGGSPQRACPTPLAVSLDPSATQFWRKIRLGKVCEPVEGVGRKLLLLLGS